MTTVVEMIGELATGDLTPESGLTFLTSMEDHLRLANATSASEMNLVTPCFHFQIQITLFAQSRRPSLAQTRWFC